MTMPHDTLTATDSQTQVVQAHFDAASRQWAARYDGPPRRMSDLDLQLRRETARRWLQTLLSTRGLPLNPPPAQGGVGGGSPPAPVSIRHQVGDTDCQSHATVAPRLHILDVGCGPGQTLDGFSRRQLCVHGIDVSPEMIAAASRRHPEDQYHIGDATALPFADASMDVTLCLGVLEYVPEPQQVLMELRRVLRPGGRLIVSFPNRMSAFRRLSRVETAVERRLLQLVRRGDGATRVAERPKYRHRHWSLREALGLLNAAGFVVERRRFQTFGLWGWLGRGRAAVGLSAWLTRHLGEHAVIARCLACTLVVQAQRP